MTNPPVSPNNFPNVMLDAVRIGMSGAVHGPTTTAVADFLELAMSIEGIHLKRTTNPNQIKIRFPIEELDDNRLLGEAELDLYFSGGTGPLRLNQRSAISINPQKIVRGTLGGTAADVLVGLDGNDNVLEPDQHLPTLLDSAINKTNEVIDVAVDLINNCLPTGSEFRWDAFWIKSAEVCRDIHLDDAVEGAHRACHAAISGTVEAVQKLYKPSTGRHQNSPALRWVQGKSKPEYKVYAKTHKLLRVELAARDRAAVCALTDSRDTTDYPQEVGDLLLDFAILAEPQIDQLEEHVRQSIESVSNVPVLMTALLPLINLAAGIHQRRGPGPNQISVKGARDALSSLFRDGMFDARGIKPGQAVRRILEGMATTGGAVTREKGRIVYYLNNSHAASSQQMMNQMVWQ